MSERLYLVCYDIADAKRWRRIYRIMNGYGEWVQLSVFQCRHGPTRHAEMLQLIGAAIADRHDHVLIIDLGPADRVEPRFTSLGRSFEPVERGPKVF